MIVCKRKKRDRERVREKKTHKKVTICNKEIQQQAAGASTNTISIRRTLNEIDLYQPQEI